MKVAEEPVVVTQEFDCSRDRLWQAITDIEQMVKWYFPDIPDFRAEVGFKTAFDVDTGERVFPHRWKVVEVSHGRKIAYDWSYDGYAGAAVVVFEIDGDENSSRLTVSCLVGEDFDDNIPEFTRDACLGGWNYFICDSLKSYLGDAG